MAEGRTIKASYAGSYGGSAQDRPKIGGVKVEGEGNMLTMVSHYVLDFQLCPRDQITRCLTLPLLLCDIPFGDYQ